jgi:N-acetylneuraminate synthase
MSTGAHTRSEVEEGVACLESHGVEGLCLLHCIASYPTPIDQINVRAVETLEAAFGVATGLSDHTTDPATAPTAAVALGADVIEKHFTLDKGMDGPDHSFALEPDELDQMIDEIRQTESALGDGALRISEVESGTVDRARRAIHAVEDISHGTRITADAVRVLRPGYGDGDGLEPKYIDDVIGAVAEADIAVGEPITENKIDFETGP